MVDLIAERFAVLAEPLRIKILDLLREREEASVQEVADALGATHANVSRHLNLLYRAAIVGRRKDGVHVRYRIADPGVFRLCEDVCGGIAQRHRQLADHLGPNAREHAA